METKRSIARLTSLVIVQLPVFEFGNRLQSIDSSGNLHAPRQVCAAVLRCVVSLPKWTFPTDVSPARVVHRLALYARQTTQSFHLVHLDDFDARPRRGRDGVDRRHLRDERIREGTDQPHSRHGCACDDFRRERTCARLAARCRCREEKSACDRRRTVCRGHGAVARRTQCTGDHPRRRHETGTDGFRPRQENDPRQARRSAARFVRHHSWQRIGDEAGRRRRRQSHCVHRRYQRHAGRCDAARQAFRCRRHFLGGISGIRRRPRRHQYAGRRTSLSARWPHRHPA